MVYLETFTTTINLNIYLICIIAIIYIMIHQNRHRQFNQYLDVYLNYILYLHEFGHVLFNKISGGLGFSHRHTAFGTTSNDATRLCYYPIQRGSLDNFIYNSRWLYYASINAFNWSKCCVLWSP